MPRTYDAYPKYLAADEIARAEVVNDELLVQALGRLVDLLDQRLFGEQLLGPLDDTPELLLSIEDAELGGFVVVSTRAGRVHLFREEQGFESVGSAGLAGFDPTSERVIGLYATRRASRVRDQLDVLVVVRGNAGARAHVFALAQLPLDRDIDVAGHHVPPALQACPIALPLGASFDCFDLHEVPPEGALGVVLDVERNAVVVAKNGLAGGQPCLEGRHIARIGQRIATIDRHQTVLWVATASEPEWFLMLEHQPLCIAPLPASAPLRMAIGLESGVVLVARDLGDGKVEELWQRLVERLRSLTGIDALDGWIAWAITTIDAMRSTMPQRDAEQHDQRAVAVLWIVLEQAVCHADLGDEGCAAIRQLFQRTLGSHDRHVLHAFARRLVAGWLTRSEIRGAAAIRAAYEQLPHGIQDLFDAELLAASDQLGTLTRDAAPTPDREAIEALLLHCRVGRADLYTKSSPPGRAMLRAEARLDGYVRERASLQLDRSNGVLRWPGEGKRIYMVVAHKLLFCDIDELTLHKLRERPIEPWIRPTQSVSLVRDSEGRTHLLLVDARQLEFIALDDDQHTRRIAESGSIAQVVSCRAGELLELRAVDGGTLLTSLYFDGKQIAASAAMSTRRRLSEHAALLTRDGRGFLLASDIAGSLAVFELLANQLDEFDAPQVHGAVRSIALLEGREPAWLVGTTKGALYRLELDPEARVVHTRWLYRHRGAVRHIAVAGHAERTRIVTMSAPDDATVLDQLRRRRWHTRVDTPLRSAVVVDAEACSRVAVFDVEGRLSSYFDPDFAGEDDLVEDEGEPSARRELWQAARAARRFADHPRSLTDFRGRAAKAAWFHGLAEQLAIRPDAVLAQLERDSAHATFRDRLVLIRSIEAAPSATLAALWRWVLDDYRKGEPDRPHKRGDDSRGAASAMFAELVRTTARCGNTPTQPPFSTLIDELIGLELMRDSAWIVQSLLLWARDHLDIDQVIAWSTRLGPLGLTMARHIASSHTALAGQLDQMCHAIVERRVIQDAEQPVDDRELQLLWLLLRLLSSEGSSWPYLVELAHRLANVREGTHPRPAWLHPALVELMNATKEFWVFHDAADMHLELQRETLDQIKGVFLSTPRELTGPWSDWLAVARPLLEERAAAAAQDYWRRLPKLLRVRVPELALDVFAQGRIARLRVTMQLDGQGDDNTFVELRLELPEGFQVLADHSTERRLRWADVPKHLHWLVSVPARSGGRDAALLGVTIAVVRADRVETTLHRTHSLQLPAVQQGRSTGNAAIARQLDELAQARQRHARIRVLPLDPDTLAESDMINLLARRLELFDADRELQHIQDPAQVLARLAAIPTAALIYPMTSTAARLLELGVEPTPSLSQARAPQVWVLPPDLAGSLHARLHPALRWGAWYQVDARDESALREIASVRGDELDDLRSELDALAGDLRALWRRPGHELVRGWLSNPDATRGYLRHALAGCDPIMLIGLVLTTLGRVAVPRRDLVAGMIADESFSSTAERGRSKGIIAVGTLLDDAKLARLASDRRPPERLWVRGWAQRGMQGPDLLVALERVFTASRGADVFARLADRGLVVEHVGVMRPAEPMHTILRALVRNDGDLVATLEWLLALELDPLHKSGPTSSRLLGQLSIAALAPAGPLLPRLCGSLLPSAAQLLVALAALHREGPSSATLGELARVFGEASGAVEQLEHASGWMMPLRAGQHLRLVWCNHPVHLPPAHPGEVFVVLGPGARASSAHVLLLDDERIRELLAAPDVRRALMNMVITRAGFEAFSPYQVGSALPGDSVVFVGRASETERILRNIHQFSFLIVGGRQIGKTSLLRHIERQVLALPEPRVQVVPGLDLAGQRHPQALLRALARHHPDLFDADEIEAMDTSAAMDASVTVDATASAAMDASASAAVDAIEHGLRRLAQKQKPVVLFIDEVDTMLDSPLFERLRMLSQNNLVQCVMTGYHRARAMTSDRNHPFFHWVRGFEGKKAFVLGRIDEQAARQLVERLEAEPLAFTWAADEREAGIRHLLDATHRIPMLLQAACAALVRRLDKEERRTLTLADVEGYRAKDWQGPEAADLGIRTTEFPVWTYVQMLQKLPDPLITGIPGGALTSEPWVALVLGCLVQRLYFDRATNAAPVRADAQPKAFTTQDAIAWTDAALTRHRPLGLDSLRSIFGTDLYRRLFDDLSLSVLVEPTIDEDAFQFAGNIYPIELGRFLQRRSLASVDEWLLNQIANIETAIRTAQTAKQ